jgi:hypothetical protein
MLDSKNDVVPMFWQAQNPSESYELPGTITFDQTKMEYFETHYWKYFPAQSALTAQPDQVTMRVRVQPVGLDVIDDLVGSGDLDPAVRANMPTFDVGAKPLVTWTQATATMGFTDENNTPYTCVTNTSGGPFRQVPAPAHVYCKP